MDESVAGAIETRRERAAELESLKGRIMADIETKLSQKEESLWRRGQVEIRRLQVEQQQVTQQISKMQESQAALNAENQKIKVALVEVTSKFEHVVNEMREVLRSLPQRSGGERPSPPASVASTSASEAAPGDDKSFEQTTEQNSSILTATEPSGLWSVDRVRRQIQTPVTPTPVSMWHARAPGEPLSEVPPFDPEDLLGAPESRTYFTPPRASPSPEDAAQQFDVVAPPPPASWCHPTLASPAPAVLSLAHALPSATPASAPSPGLKRLHLAEHIEQASSSPPPAARQAEVPPMVVGAGAAAAPTRSELINIELLKEPGFSTLGMEVKKFDDYSLRIERIDEHGLVGRYNARQDSEAAKVRVGDHIVEANGIRQDPQRMLQECKARQRLLFTILREPEGQVAAKAAGAREGSVGSEAGEAVAHDAGALGADITKVNSPSATRLRPEARVFVPSAQKEAAPAPPGLECFESGPQTAEPGMPAGGAYGGQVSLADQEEVKRALFP